MCVMTKKHEAEQARSTQFVCHAPDEKGVFLAGTFNDWNPKSTPMAKDAKGQWVAVLDLKPDRYEFKFVVDGVWCCEPGCDGTNRNCPKCVPNAFGTMNRVIEVR